MFQRQPADVEVARVGKFIEFQKRFNTPDTASSKFINSPWPLIAQSLMMSNEFQYTD